MSIRPPKSLKNRSTAHRNSSVLAKRSRRQLGPFVKRVAQDGNALDPSFSPPETWYEPAETGGTEFDIIVQNPGPGYRHIVTPDEIRSRLGLLPSDYLEPLETIQLSEMTRKKRRFPCYGMQWGSALYLYPVETNLVEYFARPPKPAQRIESQMYGGRWIEDQRGHWRLCWTEQSIKNFYLNNILMHELGHLLDDRNTSYTDRERYAEWFALEYGYKSAHQKNLAACSRKQVRRRHHSRQS